MALRYDWTPKTNNDSVEAEDINTIAEAVIELENNPPSGGGVVVDSQMSDKSTNPIQNKVVKKYVDDTRDNLNTQITYSNGLAASAGQMASQAKTTAEDALGQLAYKQDKVEILTEYSSTSITFNALEYHLTDYRAMISPNSVDFNFATGEYPKDYITGLSFYSDETPPTVSYTTGNIINWVGTDCSADTYTTAVGEILPASIFQPSADTQYDIIIYFNGTCFVGMVNGYKLASYNKTPSSGGDTTEW